MLRPRASPFMQYRIVDQSGVDIADDTPGELLVRAAGPDPRAGFFTEYLGDPRRPKRRGKAAGSTPATWCGGMPDENLYFVDRWKNVIRRSGENIAAAEVESVLRQHRLVRDVACAAVPDELRGEEVLACIVPREPVADKAARCGGYRGACARRARLLQGAGLCRVRRCAAADGDQQDPARRTEDLGARASRHTRLHRHAPPEAPNAPA